MNGETNLMGRWAVDRVTGFSGVVTAEAMFIDIGSCVHIQAPVDAAGNMRGGLWAQVDRVKIDESVAPVKMGSSWLHAVQS